MTTPPATPLQLVTSTLRHLADPRAGLLPFGATTALLELARAELAGLAPRPSHRPKLDLELDLTDPAMALAALPDQLNQVLVDAASLEDALAITRALDCVREAAAAFAEIRV